MKKFICLVAVIAFVCLVSGIASAEDYYGSRIGAQRLLSKAIFADTGNLNGAGHCHITTSPTWVYRVTFTPTKAGAFVMLYDTAGQYDTQAFTAYLSDLTAAQSKGSVKVKADIGEATANNCKTVTYDPPLYFANGLLAGMGGESAGTIAVIEYN